MNVTTRRSFFKSASIAAVAAPTAAIAAVPTETQIQKLYRQWRAACEVANSASMQHHTFAEVDALVDKANEIEDAMLALPAQTAGDVLTKISACTSEGYFASVKASNAMSLEAEIYAFAGVTA